MGRGHGFSMPGRLAGKYCLYNYKNKYHYYFVVFS